MKTNESPVAEFLATTLFFLLGFWLDEVTPLPTPLAWGAALWVIQLAFGGISGAHVNPAVTIGLVAAGRFPFMTGVQYIFAQLCGGVVGTLLPLYLTTGGNISKEVRRYIVKPKLTTSDLKIFLMEAGGAFLLSLIVIVATDERSQKWAAGLLIGGALGLAIWIAEPVSGGSINPVRALAPVVIASESSLLAPTAVLFVLSTMLGGVVSGLFGREFQSS